MKNVIALFLFLLFGAGAFAQHCDSLRIITYNIHHAEPPGRPGTIDLDAFASILKKYDADVIALQEVDVNTKRSGNIHQAAVMAERLSMHFFFAKAIDHDGGEYGVALLSKYRLRDTQVVGLPMDSLLKGEKRVLAVANLTLPSGRLVTIACTHLDHQRNPKNRERQMTVINSVAKTVTTTFVIAGDFNAEPDSDVVKQFEETFQKTCKACPPTFPATQPNRTIDYIGFKKTKKIDTKLHQVLPEPALSDHSPVLAVLCFR